LYSHHHKTTDREEIEDVSRGKEPRKTRVKNEGDLPLDMTESGRIPRITKDRVMSVFEGREDGCEPLSAKEIGDELDCTRKTATRWLKRLEADDRIASKEMGARAKAWWVPARKSE
jgi:CRP-like cAMP-binding protein